MNVTGLVPGQSYQHRPKCYCTEPNSERSSPSSADYKANLKAGSLAGNATLGSCHAIIPFARVEIGSVGAQFGLGK